MAKKIEGFTLEIDAETGKKLVEHLKDEGVMQAGFVIHDSNNFVLEMTNEAEKNADKDVKE